MDAERQAVHGPLAAERLRRYVVDKAFVGADGCSLARGLSANGEAEAALTLAALAGARHAYLLCDFSKLEQDKYVQFAPLASIGTLLTGLLAELLTRYREAGLAVLT